MITSAQGLISQHATSSDQVMIQPSAAPAESSSSLSFERSKRRSKGVEVVSTPAPNFGRVSNGPRLHCMSGMRKSARQAMKKAAQRILSLLWIETEGSNNLEETPESASVDCVATLETALQTQCDIKACDLLNHRQVLVYGEVGVGKSLLIHECTEGDAKSGKKSSGVTKHVREYMLKDSCRSIGLVDCPGAGDHDISVPEVLDELASSFSGSFSAVVLVIRADHTRFTVGQQYISKALNIAFSNNIASSNNIILVATHWDKVDEIDRKETETEVRKVAKKFAETIEGSRSAAIPSNQIIMRQKGDTSNFKACLCEIIHRKPLQLLPLNPKQWFGVYHETFHSKMLTEDAQRLFDRVIQEPRKQKALQRLIRAQDSNSLEELRQQFSSAKVILGEDNCFELCPFKENI